MQPNGTLANIFIKAESNADKNIIFLIMQAYSPRRSTKPIMQQRSATKLKIPYKSVRKNLNPIATLREIIVI